MAGPASVPTDWIENHGATPIVSESIVESVLLVESDDGLRRTIAEALRREAFHVVDASDGASALTLLRDMRGSLEWLVTHVRLPILSGLHVAFEFRFTNPKSPIIFMTDREVSDEPNLLLGSETLHRPFSIDRLLPLMRALREKRHRPATIGL